MDIRKLHQLEQQAAALREAREQLEEILPELCRTHRLYYDCLINAGFTDEQAIHLVATHGASFGLPPQNFIQGGDQT